MPELRDIAEAAQELSGLSRRVLDYSLEMKRMVDAAKQPGFSAESWAGLAEYVNTDKFIRVGNFKEVMTWADYIAFLTPWAMHSEWEGSFKRVTEQGQLVLLELEERSRVGGHTSVVNSVSVYEFGEDGRIEHLDIYLQMPMPDPEMLASYSGVQISG
jgi:hypothetical protein